MPHSSLGHENLGPLKHELQVITSSPPKQNYIYFSRIACICGLFFLSQKHSAGTMFSWISSSASSALYRKPIYWHQFYYNNKVYTLLRKSCLKWEKQTETQRFGEFDKCLVIFFTCTGLSSSSSTFEACSCNACGTEYCKWILFKYVLLKRSLQCDKGRGGN